MVHHDGGVLHPGSGRPGVRAGRILGDQSDSSVLAAASGDGSDHKRSRTPCLTARFHPRRPLVAGSGSPEPRLLGGDSAASKGTLIRAGRGDSWWAGFSCTSTRSFSHAGRNR